MIKERVDKDHTSVFRSALTSISKVNKTDVETLRSSIGVWGFHMTSAPLSLMANQDSSRQSFADIADAPAERLEKLPGFGQVKVKRLRDVFDRPFQGTRTVVPRTDPQPPLMTVHPHPPDDPQDAESDIAVSS